ncbi:hypothetical protein Tco_0762531, partial [Tanacetum coccineum]
MSASVARGHGGDGGGYYPSRPLPRPIGTGFQGVGGRKATREAEEATEMEEARGPAKKPGTSGSRPAWISGSVLRGLFVDVDLGEMLLDALLDVRPTLGVHVGRQVKVLMPLIGCPSRSAERASSGGTFSGLVGLSPERAKLPSLSMSLKILTQLDSQREIGEGNKSGSGGGGDDEPSKDEDTSRDEDVSGDDDI